MDQNHDKKSVTGDEDWKKQAQLEKEKLSQKEQQTRSARPAEREMPPANFLALLNSMMLQALLYMGKLSDPNDQKARDRIDLDLAKHYIDLMGVLEEKTKGNLTDEENKALSLSLHEVRMQYVQMASQS